MESRCGLCFEAGQLLVTSSEHPQHRHMILGLDTTEAGLVESDDGHRTSIIGVVLLRPSRIQHSSP
jgi:hypothetical protein